VSDTTDVLARIASLERSSRSAIPFALVALVASLGAIYFAYLELAQTRRGVTEAENRLTATQLVIEQAQAKVDALNATLTALSERVSPQNEPAVRAAIEQAATIDASLAVAGSKIQGPPSKTGTLRYGSMSVDLFYCEDSGPASKDAALAAQSLRQNNSTGRWRVRELSQKLNANEGYRVASNVIRFNPDEREIASRLAVDLGNLLSSEVALQEIAYPTPGYISVFLCKPQK
jgi:hypothetical protein